MAITSKPDYGSQLTLDGIATERFQLYLDDITFILNTPAPLTTVDWVNVTNTPTTLAGYGITDAQALDAGLTSIAGLVTAADEMIYATALDTYATTSLTAFARTLLDDADAGTARATLGVVIGTDVQAHSAVLDATTASYTTAEETKLSGIEALADVTDSANVLASLVGQAVVATSYSGDLTGNVTGNVSGTAATVTGAAQTAITSLGTLTSLAVTGEITGAGFTGNLDGVLGGGTPATAAVTTLTTTGAASITGNITAGQAVSNNSIKVTRTGANPSSMSINANTDAPYIGFASNGTDSLDFFDTTFIRGFRINSATSGVNYLEVYPSSTGNAVSMLAAGSDTNVDIALTPKGSGVLRFGTHSTIAAETVTGYITIKDSGGTSRKVAVVS